MSESEYIQSIRNELMSLEKKKKTLDIKAVGYFEMMIKLLGIGASSDDLLDVWKKLLSMFGREDHYLGGEYGTLLRRITEERNRLEYALMEMEKSSEIKEVEEG